MSKETAKRYNVQGLEARFRTLTGDDSIMGQMYSNLSLIMELSNGDGSKMTKISPIPADNCLLEFGKLAAALLSFGIADAKSVQLVETLRANEAVFSADLDTCAEVSTALAGTYKSRPFKVSFDALKNVYNAHMENYSNTHGNAQPVVNVSPIDLGFIQK